MPQVMQVAWLSEAAREAEVTVGDGEFELVCFCQPCRLEIGQTIGAPLHTLDAREILIEPADAPIGVDQRADSFENRITARLIDPARRLVALGQIALTLDGEIPGDAIEGDVISFCSDRIDIDSQLEIETGRRVIRSVPWDHEFVSDRGGYELTVLAGGVALYEITFRLDEEEAAAYRSDGEAYLDQLVQRVQKNNGIYAERAKAENKS